MVDLVPKKTMVILVQNLRLGGSAKTWFKNANLGLPVQTTVESASSTLCLLIHLWKQNRRRNLKRKEEDKKKSHISFVCLNIWTFPEAILTQCQEPPTLKRYFSLFINHRISDVVGTKMHM